MRHTLMYIFITLRGVIIFDPLPLNQNCWFCHCFYHPCCVCFQVIKKGWKMASLLSSFVLPPLSNASMLDNFFVGYVR